MFLDLINDRKEARTANKVLPKWRHKRFYETFPEGSGQVALNSTAVILLNFSANNPPLRQYPKPLVAIRRRQCGRIAK